jgi:hypothetical protein
MELISGVWFVRNYGRGNQTIHGLHGKMGWRIGM